MYIITQQGQTIGHRIGNITIGDQALQVELTSKSVDPYPGPDGPISEWSNVVPVPVMELGPNPKLTVAEFLTSEGQSFEGGEIVADEEFAFRAKRADLLMKVKRKRDATQEAGVVTPFGPMQTDLRSMVMVTGAVNMAKELAGDFSLDWRMADDTIVTLDDDEMIQIGLLVGQHMALCQSRKNALDAAIAAAVDVEELDLIDVDSGWPS